MSTSRDSRPKRVLSLDPFFFFSVSYEQAVARPNQYLAPLCPVSIHHVFGGTRNFDIHEREGSMYQAAKAAFSSFFSISSWVVAGSLSNVVYIARSTYQCMSINKCEL